MKSFEMNLKIVETKKGERVERQFSFVGSEKSSVGTEP